MMESVWLVLHGIAFGFGVSFTILALLLFYQTFIEKAGFKSRMLIVQFSILLLTTGLTLLWVVFNV